MSRATDAADRATKLLDNPAYTMAQADWLATSYDPKPGQHHIMIGPNGCGKTTLGMRLLAAAHVHNPGTRGLALVMKPDVGPKSDGRGATGDPTVSALTVELGGRVVRQWPPPPSTLWKGEPTFWALWPRHTFDPDRDEYAHAELFRRAILDSYQKGDRWIFCDELMGLTQELGLGRVATTVFSKGRSMKCGVIGATQRPAFVPQASYSEAKHVFLWPMRDAAAYDRLGEIGGGGAVDPWVIRAILPRLSKHQCLYLHVETETMAILT